MSVSKKQLWIVLLLLAALCFSLFSCSDDDAETNEEEPSEQVTECQHTTTTVKNKKAATCTAEGYTGDTVCSACGKITKKGSSVAKTEHVYDEGQITKAPTCATTGVKTYTCSGCLITKTETVPVTDCQNEFHYESNEIHKIVCNVCYTTENGEHTKGETVSVSDATCTEGAYTVYTCKDCKNDYKVYDITKPALGHAWDEENIVVVPATCAKDGSQHFVCTADGCGATTTPVTLPKNAALHDFQREISHVDADCTAEGKTVFGCLHCEATQTKVLPKTAHTYGAAVTDGGWSYKTCSDCGHEISSYSAKNDTSASLSTSKIEENKALKVDLKDASIEFPSAIVDLMKENTDVKINAGILDQGKKEDLLQKPGMSAEDKAVLSESKANIYDFGVSTGNEDLHQFSAAVTVTLPYTLGENEEPEGIVIWYVDEDGKVTAVENVTFADADGDGTGEVTFTVEHFSFYAVAYKETPEMRCRRGFHDYSDKQLWKAHEATCVYFGYTEKTCVVCGNVGIEDYVSPISHEYGAKQQPTVDCENGGYVYDRCKNCTATRHYEYVPATGHTVDGIANCTTGVSCKTCHKTIVAALGHSFTEWEVVVKPAVNKEGLKRRHCPRCGAVEEAKIVGTDIEPLSFDTYEEFIDICLKDVFNFGSGSVSFSYTADRRTETFRIKVCEDKEGYTAEIKLDSTYTNSDGETETGTGLIYYRNGVIVYSESDEDDGDQNTVILTDTESLFGMTVQTMLSYIENAYKAFSPELESALNMLSENLHGKLNKNEAQIDKTLATMGCPYTAKELVATFDSIQTVYAYTAAKLGFESSVTFPEGVTVPTKEDWHNFLAAMMTKKEVGGNVEYTLDAAKLIEAVDSLLAWTEEHLDAPLSDIIIELYGDSIRQAYPDVTDWDKLVAQLKKEFAGQMPVKDAVDKLIGFAESTGMITMDELYTVIESVFFAKDADLTVEDVIAQYADKTLDAFAKEVTGENSATFSKVLDSLSESMKKRTLADLMPRSDESEDDFDDNYDDSFGGGNVTVRPITPKEQSDSASNVLSSLQALRAALEELELGLTIVLDKNGNLISFVANEHLDGFKSFAFDLKKDDSVKVTIPKEYEKHIGISVSYQFDQNGNLMISGLPANKDASFIFDGRAEPSIREFLTLNDALTKQYGYNIYTIDSVFSKNSESIKDARYAMDSDGNFYSFTYEYVPSHHVITQMVPMSELSTAQPDENSTPIAYYDPDNTRNFEYMIPVYQTVVGFAYRDNGKWMLIDTRNSHVEHYYYFAGVGSFPVYCELKAIPYQDAIESLVISNGNYSHDGTVYDADGKQYHTVYRTFAEIDGLNYNIELSHILVDDRIVLIASRFTDSVTNVIVGNKVTDLPKYDDYEYYRGMHDNIYKDGVLVDDEYEIVVLTVKVPTYYAEFDGVYFELEKDEDRFILPFASKDVSDLKALTLPDGKKLYVCASDGETGYHGYTYGYIAVKDGLYAQAACYFVNGQWQHTEYRQNPRSYSSAEKTLWFHFDEVFDANDYVKKNADGTYTLDGKIIEKLKGYCIDEENELSLVILTDLQENGNPLLLKLRKELIHVPADLTVRPSNELYVNWSHYMGYGEEKPGEPSDYFFEIVANKDGSVTLKSADGTILDLTFYFDDFDAESDEMYQYNQVLSDKTGLEIYSVYTANKQSNDYVLINGKYYSFYYSSRYQVTKHQSVSPADAIARSWYVGDLYYQFDELSANGKSFVGRVYTGTLYFNPDLTHISNALCYETSCYFQIIDGKLYILTEVSEASDTKIRYEGKMPVSEYIASLHIQELEYTHESPYIMNGKKVQTVSYALFEGDQYLCDIGIPFYMNGESKVYFVITDTEYEDYIVVDEEETQFVGNHMETNRIAYTDFTGNYTIATVLEIHTNEEHYVKLGTGYVSYDSYMNNRLTKQEFYNRNAYIEYYYGILQNGKWVIYNDASWEWDDYFGWHYVLFDPMQITDTEGMKNNGEIGSTIDKETVYEFMVYSIDHLICVTLPDGRKYYHEEYSDYGHLEVEPGYYLNVGVFMNGDSYHVEHWDSDKYYDTTELICGALKLYDYVQFTTEGITLSSELVRLLSPYSDQFYFRVESDSDSQRLYYNDLESWFAK